MGIPGFSTWLRQRYPEAFEDPKSSRRHDAVYVYYLHFDSICYDLDESHELFASVLQVY